MQKGAMNWEQRYRLIHAARISLVLWASTALIAGVLVARGVRWIDIHTGWIVYGYGPDGARAVLSALVSSMLTFIVFVLSAVLIVVQLASGQMTPRVIALVFALPWLRRTLMVFTFTYTYTLGALARVEDHVLDLHASLAMLLNLVCVIVFFQFVQRLSNALRPSTIVQLVGDRGREVIADVYPAAFDPKRPESAPASELPTTQPLVIEYSGRSGVVMAVGVEDLARIARAAGAVVELVPQVGDSVCHGDPLFRVFGGTQALVPGTLRGCVAIGTERTLDQDPRFPFRILVDIANKALSPAINDPTTAVLALDQIDNLLLFLGKRRLDEGLARDPDGTPRVVYGTPDWPDFVLLAVTEIRHYGATSVQVNRRLRAMLDHLIGDLPAERRPPLEAELALLGSAVERGFSDAEDRKRAAPADFQGVGGSEE
jgi:uncharacterized membrane protein